MRWISMERFSCKSGVFLSPVSRLCRVDSGGTLACLLRLSVLVLLILLVAAPGQGQTLSSISISPSQPTVVIGGTTQLTATATYSNGSATNVSGSVTWSSSDPRMINVSSSGVGSGLATGN